MYTKGNLDAPNPSGDRNNLQSDNLRKMQKPTTHLFASISRYFNIYQKLPYDNAAVPVKRNDKFREVGHGHIDAYATP